MTCEVWYPAAEEARGAPGVAYPIVEFLPESLKMKLGGRDPGSFETTAVRDAAPNPDEGPFPLVVFSHGAGSLRLQSTYLTVYLASHGFVVAAPDHAGNTLPELDSVEDLGIAGQLDSFFDRPEDLRKVIDHFEDLAADDPLFGAADPSRAGAVGHSFGGTTALRTAGLDPRVRAAIGQTPAGYTATWLEVDRPLDSLGIPIMVQSGGKDETIPGDAPPRSFWDRAKRPRYLVKLATAGHFTFSDLCRLDREALAAADDIGIGNALEDGCGPENIRGDLAYPLIRHFTIGLFSGYLRNSPQTVSKLTPAEATRLAPRELVLEADP